jgi:hypothetical protein
MPLEQIFSMASLLALAGWVLLVILPRNPVVQLLSGVVLPLVISGGYLLLIAQNLNGAEGGFGSLADVRALFSNDAILLAGWLHYLAFDLFIGAWESRDAQRNGIPHLVVIPCLIMTFMLGPIGLLFYFAIRTAKTKAVKLDQAA